MSGTRVLCSDGKRNLCSDGKRRKVCGSSTCPVCCDPAATVAMGDNYGWDILICGRLPASFGFCPSGMSMTAKTCNGFTFTPSAMSAVGTTSGCLAWNTLLGYYQSTAALGTVQVRDGGGTLLATLNAYGVAELVDATHIRFSVRASGTWGSYGAYSASVELFTAVLDTAAVDCTTMAATITSAEVDSCPAPDAYTTAITMAEGGTALVTVCSGYYPCGTCGSCCWSCGDTVEWLVPSPITTASSYNLTIAIVALINALVVGGRIRMTNCRQYGIDPGFPGTWWRLAGQFRDNLYNNPYSVFVFVGCSPSGAPEGAGHWYIGYWVTAGFVSVPGSSYRNGWLNPPSSGADCCGWAATALTGSDTGDVSWQWTTPTIGLNRQSTCCHRSDVGCAQGGPYGQVQDCPTGDCVEAPI